MPSRYQDVLPDPWQIALRLDGWWLQLREADGAWHDWAGPYGVYYTAVKRYMKLVEGPPPVPPVPRVVSQQTREKMGRTRRRLWMGEEGRARREQQAERMRAQWADPARRARLLANHPSVTRKKRTIPDERGPDPEE